MTPDDRIAFERRLIEAAPFYGHEHDHKFESVLDEFEEAVLGRSEWQPIETAPKDGEKILLGYFPEPAYDGAIVGESCEVAFWHGTHKKWCSRTLLNAEGYFSPTHWMPLPRPP